jgi:hypothetical protein
LKRGIAAKGRRGRFDEHRSSGTRTDLVQAQPFDNSPDVVHLFFPSHLPVAEPLSTPPGSGRAGEVEAYDGQRCRIRAVRHFDPRNDELRRIDRGEIVEQRCHLGAKSGTISQRSRRQTGRPEHFELRAPAGRCLAEPKPASLEPARQQVVDHVQGSTPLAAQRLRQLSETDSEFLRFFFSGKSVAAGNEMFLHGLERRRDAPLRVVPECLG